MQQNKLKAGQPLKRTKSSRLSNNPSTIATAKKTNNFVSEVKSIYSKKSKLTSKNLQALSVANRMNTSQLSQRSHFSNRSHAKSIRSNQSQAKSIRSINSTYSRKSQAHKVDRFAELYQVQNKRKRP